MLNIYCGNLSRAMIDLKPEYLDEIKRILAEQMPNYEVRAFGSRVNGKASSYSDLDLVLMGKKQINWRKIEELKEAFSESTLPFMVDILDWHTLSKAFKKSIKAHSALIQKQKGERNDPRRER